jgi:uridine kinase
MNKIFAAGIAGGSASGKSTLCDKLEKELSGYKLAVIHTDSYFKPDNERIRKKAFVTGREYLDDNHPEDTIYLHKLRKDAFDIIYQNEHDILLIEGIFTLWDDVIFNMLDLKIFIDCKPDERIVRRLKRNMNFGLSFDEIADVYLDMVRYRHEEYVEPSKWRADIIITGSNPTDASFDILAGYIKSRVMSDR